MMRKNTNGSVLVLILVIAVAAGLLLSSLAKVSLSERRMNEDSRLMLEAKDAAEATVECGFSQLVVRFEQQNSFPSNSLSPEQNPLRLTKPYYDLFETGTGRTDSKVQLPGYPYDPEVDWGSYETELIGGMVPPGEWKFIDGDIPGNEFDPLRDKRVFIRQVHVYGKATVKDETTGREQTARVRQSLQVRDAPLFAHAIFYNMDMEIAPGQPMDIMGAVHANGDLYIQAGNSLNFHKNVSATGQLHHGRHPESGKGAASGGVNFADGLGDLKSMKVGGTWLESSVEDFRSLASNRWNGNVQTFEHGIQKHNPVGIDDYVADDPETSASDDDLNYAYHLIQPLDLDRDTRDIELEKQRLAYQAGVVIDLDKDNDGGDVEEVEIYSYQRDGEGNIEYYADGRPKTKILYSSSHGLPRFLEVEDYEADEEEDEVDRGLYDYREGRSMSLVRLNVGILRAAVELNNKKKIKAADDDVPDDLREAYNNRDEQVMDWRGDGDNGESDSIDTWDNSGAKNADPDYWWNGVVYVKFPQGVDSGRKDGVVPAEKDWALQAHNGQKIPNPNWGYGDDLYGMTLATNAPLYVQGHYNSDGDLSTGSPTDPDVNDPEEEPPAAFAADAITVLSSRWDNRRSLEGTPSAGDTEVSAAFLTGLVPSGKGSGKSYSGGVENFPRLLEDWGGDTLRYRGSMVALFESEVATGEWSYGGNIYKAPKRRWGFNKLFGEGFYPPGTPNTRTFRRINYRYMTQHEYDKALVELAEGMGL